MGNGLCVGGVTNEGVSVRLMPTNGYSHEPDAPYQVGDVWDVATRDEPNVRPPHIEDVRLVAPGTQVDRLGDPAAWIMNHVEPWTGSAATLFEGCVRRRDETGRAFVGDACIPPNSVGFWLPDRPLVRHSFEHRDNYVYTDHEGARWSFSYAGTAPALRLIPAYQLIRVSLARWWAPDGTDQPEACYAQISGWFPVEPREHVQRTPSRKSAVPR